MSRTGMTRRAFGGAMAGFTLAARWAQTVRGQDQAGEWFYPVALEDRLPGEGFLIRHGFQCENTWYHPGWWHCGEDWYRLDDEETGGALVYAVAPGEVVFAGSDYPGRVVIIRQADDLFSMYGHLDFEGVVAEGAMVAAGEQIGTVLFRRDDRAPSHLHFEVRTFLTTRIVNGNAPRYNVGCGFECPPGPGYWPIDAPELPVAVGWRNPLHAIGAGMESGRPGDGAEVQVTASGRFTLREEPANDAPVVTEREAAAGDRWRWLETAAGEPDTESTSADGYRLWFRVAIGSDEGWVRAAVPDDGDTGGDGRPSSIRFPVVPVR